MIVGDDILKRGLIKDGNPNQLKNGTYNLTIGEIFPVGREEANKKSRDGTSICSYSLAPQEMVWVISKEYFELPSNVTGLATLRTTYTHQGLLALNVGIIDSHFKGQISTVIINFSDRTRTIWRNEPFFRVMFFEHNELSQPDNTDKPSTRKDVLAKAASDFPKNFLNLPGSNSQYYGDQLGKLVFGFIKSRPIKSAIFFLLFCVILIDSSEKIIQFLDVIGVVDIEKVLSLIGKGKS
ncbi:MAG: hypothetical protein JKY82_02985 [Rhizobiaceae bacterium]|nr:hypothetical protein [Rhizobiaceae bacterium]